MSVFKRLPYGLAIIFFLCKDISCKSIPLNALTVQNCGKSLIPVSSPDRIVGGDYAGRGQYPWMVSLRERSNLVFEHVCGASILNKDWIVTAAHCLDYSSPRRYEILAGLHKLSEEFTPTVKRYKISKIIIHEDYDDDTFENDLALLKTTKPIDIAGSKGFINGVCLPQNKSDPTGYGTVIGWGHTKEDGRNSNTLKHVTVPIIERKICNEMYDEDLHDGVDEILDTMICAGMTGRDSCQNDSGGPLLQTDSNGVTTLIGIVSHGAGCGLKYYPGVYTKISMYHDWMASKMN
ncbi:u21-ctenitoxin-Pn1a [Trichonephila inaurata madagascariensis]|uniref:U21-ctenitoxin-Pn1a n=1 Tax=Trichonephila inaurata madagascariensis TaxID=2747483 RepID=A0A8X6YL00_9ARAC|nr:u21-ctenitoxin-Pn1a [Trichonephila inaurata madagascariensis]